MATIIEDYLRSIRVIIAPELEYIAYSNKSVLGRLSPFTKFILLLLYLFLNIFITNYLYFIFAGGVFFLLLLSKVQVKYFYKPLFIAFFTSIVVFVAKMHFLKKGIPVSFIIDFYPESFLNAIISSLKIVFGIVLIVIFISTTPIKEMLSVLKKLKVPDILIEIFLVVFKYIFILNDEGIRMKNAQTVRLGYCSFRRSLESFGNLIGMIMLRSINKGFAMSEALYVRGYKGRLFYPAEIPTPKLYEYIIILFLGIIPLFLSIYV